MWGFLEQQSFPLNEEEFREKLAQVIDFLNRTGQKNYVRFWLLNLSDRPRVGRALSLPLMEDGRLKEFDL